MKQCRLKQNGMAKPVHRKGVSAFFRSYPVYIDKANKDNVVLIDASGLGEKIKDGKNQKTVLSHAEEQKICDTFAHKQAVEDFSVVVGYDEIKAKNYSLSAGQYFEVKIDYVDISADEFVQKMA